jgi:protein TonB
MNKFFIFSISCHVLLGLFLLKEPDKKISLKNKQMMNISYNSAKSVSVNQNEAVLQKNVESEPEIVKTEEVKPDILPEPTSAPAPVITKPKKIEEKKKIVTPKTKKVSKTNSNKNESKDIKVNSDSKSNKQFVLGNDGIYIANSPDGIEFEFLKIVNPKFPLMAKKVGYKELVTIKTKFLVDIDGMVKEIEILEGPEKYGFREETKKALSQWKFKPIMHEGKKIRVYFYKDFKFNIK